MKVTKAIIPVAGMGTRFLPATKAQPKEMLSVVDKPVIQYIVEEAVQAGIKDIIFVTALGKRAIEDHFDRNFELEYQLEKKEKSGALEEVRRIEHLARFAFVRQRKPLGDGHALLSALPFICEDEAVAVLFGDDIITGAVPAIGELIETFEKTGSSVVAVQDIPREHTSRYGIIDGSEVSPTEWSVSGFVEKPAPEDAPSTRAAVGRYVITSDIFTILQEQKAGKDGEIRLADAFGTHLSRGGDLTARAFSGTRYDCGNKLEFIIAQLELGMEHPEIGEDLISYLKERNE